MVARDGRPHSIAREPLQDATMRSRRLTQAIAGSSVEVGKPLIRQAAADDLDGWHDNEAGQEMSSTRHHRRSMSRGGVREEHA